MHVRFWDPSGGGYRVCRIHMIDMVCDTYRVCCMHMMIHTVCGTYRVCRIHMIDIVRDTYRVCCIHMIDIVCDAYCV